MQHGEERAMGAFDKFERSVENAVANAFSRAFRSELKPVEISSALKKALDDDAASLSRDRTVSPNEFHVSLATSDFERINQWGKEALIDELKKSVTDYAKEEDYAFVGPIDISMEPDMSQKAGTVKVTATTKRGAVAPATSNDANTQYPLLEVDSEHYLLTGAVTVIGRGSDCDITVEDPGVSRKHLELRVTRGGVIATDLHSTNGTFVEGHRISAATLVDGNTITIGRTHIQFWYSPEPA
jgi:hypothetical protein